MSSKHQSQANNKQTKTALLLPRDRPNQFMPFENLLAAARIGSNFVTKNASFTYLT